MERQQDALSGELGQLEIPVVMVLQCEIRRDVPFPDGPRISHRLTSLERDVNNFPGRIMAQTEPRGKTGSRPTSVRPEGRNAL
jgi:hypothetical protein